MSSSRIYIQGSNVISGEDHLHPKVHLSMRDLYSIQNEFNQYANTDELLPKLIAKGLLSESEIYTIRNPYIPPNRKTVELFQCISNKGPFAPEKLLECLLEIPIIPGHRYLASRLTGDNKEDASRKASSHMENKMNPLVSKKIENLKFMFADLLIDTHRYFVTSGVRLEDFRIFVSFMSASKTNSSSLFFRDHIPSLSSASTIDQLIAIINENQYWNHFNYQLLEAVIRKFGDRKIQARLENYIDCVTTFENSVSLSDYAVNVPKQLLMPDKPDFTTVKTTLHSDKDWSTYSLAETRNIQMKLCDKLNIREHALCYQDAEEGSIIIKWLIPASIQDSVIIQAQRKRYELYRIGICLLVINNVTVYINNDDQSDYENMLGPDTTMDMSSILISLDTMEKNVQDFSSILQLHRQAIIRKLSNSTTTTTVHNRQVKFPLYEDKLICDHDRMLVPVLMKQSSYNSHPTTIHQSLSTPTSLTGSRSTSPSEIISPSNSLSRHTIQSHDHIIETSRNPEIVRPTRIFGHNHNSKDDSEREDISGWIQPDSGYEDPSCWTTSTI